MTEEEKKITKRLKDDIALVTFNDNLNYGIGNLYVNINDLKIILNLILKLQEENKELREGKDTAENELKSQLEENKKLQADIEIKDKVIDLMAEDRAEIGEPKVSKQAIIDFYYKKVEEEKC